LNYYSSKFSTGRGFPAGNPIANVLVIIVGALAIGASIVLGFVAFVLLASVLLVLSAVVGIRLWWFNRKLRKAGRERGAPRGDDGQMSHELIEGEYHVVAGERRPGDSRERD
jgi:hypothetical protein